MGAVFSERVRYLYHLYAEQEKSDRRLLSENEKLYSRNMLQRKCKFLLRPLILSRDSPNVKNRCQAQILSFGIGASCFLI
jgi:hypothetical protein